MYQLSIIDEFQGDFEFTFETKNYQYLIDIDSETFNGSHNLNIKFLVNNDAEFASTNQGVKEMFKVMRIIEQAILIASEKTGISCFSFYLKDATKESLKRMNFYNRIFKRYGYNYIQTDLYVVYSK